LAGWAGWAGAADWAGQVSGAEYLRGEPGGLDLGLASGEVHDSSLGSPVS
jgi:hypothetical protein